MTSDGLGAPRPSPAANTEGLRAWRDLTPAERKEWNDGVMDPEAGRHTFQSFDHAYRLIVGREMPSTPEGDAALRGDMDKDSKK